jgi:hypothetical protein
VSRQSLLLAFLFLVIVSACQQRSDSPNQAPSATQLSVEKVPADLRHLVSLVREWGIGDDVDRGAKVHNSTPAERDSLRAAIGPHQARITAWLDSFAEGQMSEEATAFMYTQLAIEEIPDS